MSEANGLATVCYPAHGRRAPIHAPDLLTTGEIGRLMGVAPRTVAMWFDSGQLKGFRLPRRPGSLQGDLGDRRVHRRDLAQFVRDYHFDIDVGVTLADPVAANVLAIGCEVTEPGELTVLLATSSFTAGLVVAQQRPAVIVADAALGRLELAQIAGGCRVLPSYDPALVVAGREASDVLPIGWQFARLRPVRGADIAGLLTR